MVNDMMAAIKKEAAARYPNEACGVIVKVGKKSLTLPCANVSQSPQLHFIMDAQAYADASDMGEIVGIWHTHVNIPPEPSQADIVGCNNSELPWYIVSIYKTEDGFVFSEPTELLPTDYEAPYLERPYVAGVFDCYSIVRDFYKREYGVNLRDFPRVEADGRMGYTTFVERYKDEGFELLIDQEPVAGDVFILQISSDTSNHIAVYVGNEIILHHSLNRLSKRDVYGGMWQKHTTHHLRYKGLENAN